MAQNWIYHTAEIEQYSKTWRAHIIKQPDPNEWDNIDYKEGNKGIIDEHRKVLLDMLPQLTWRSGPPDGYSIDAEGNVRSDNFESYY
jgi:hypothetical protein